MDPQEIIKNRLQSEIHNRFFNNITIQTSIKQTPKKEDAIPFCNKIITKDSIIVYGYCADGHAGRQVTLFLNHLDEKIKNEIVTLESRKMDR